jgi:hypothetical protein
MCLLSGVLLCTSGVCAVTVGIVVCLRKQQSFKSSGHASDFGLKWGKIPHDLWNGDSSFWRRVAGKNAGS